RLRHLLDGDLVDAPAVEIDHFESPTAPGEKFAGGRDVTEAAQHEAGKGPEVLVLVHAGNDQRAFDIVDRNAAAEQPRAVLALDRVRIGIALALGKIAGDGGEDVGGRD